MTWKYLTTLNLTANWNFTPVTSGTLFRFQYPLATSIGVLIAQAQTLSNTVELWEVQEATAKPELEILYFEKPVFFSQRKLAIKSTAKFQPKSPWTVRIEVWSMPLSRALSILTTTSATPSSVTASTTSTPLLAANPNRKGATFWNTSSSTLFIEMGQTASASAYAVQVGPGDYYELPYNYNGAVSGIWGAANGACLVREFA